MVERCESSDTSDELFSASSGHGPRLNEEVEQSVLAKRDPSIIGGR